jgi:hypothetical protein
MNDNLNLANSELRGQQLRKQAEAWRRAQLANQSHDGNGPRLNGRNGPTVVFERLPATVVTRLADDEDERALRRLAELDGQPRIEHRRVLVAEVEGEVLAALPLDGGEPFSDPFRQTATLVQLLKLRAAELRDCASPRPGLRARLSARLGLGPKVPSGQPHVS